MAIPKINPRTILLVNKENCVMKELIAGGTITPGHLVSINSAGKYIAHGTAKGPASAVFAVEADLNGKGIDDNYVSNDWCYAWWCPRGTEINALVAANAAAIVVGDYLESAGDGTLRKLTPAAGLTLDGNAGTVTLPGNAIAQALVALDNSAVGTPARLQVIIL